MKIAFIGYKENPVNIFSELARELSKKVSGLELEQRFVPFLEDLPIVALEESEETDFIFVFAVAPEEEVEMIENKLIDVEIKTNTRILKAIINDYFSDSEEDFDKEKEDLIEKYVSTIISILFNENEFEPKEKDFSL